MSQEKLIILTAPSGSGKSTLTARLMAQFPQLAFSVSACTRAPRPGEVPGKDYYFISREAFEASIAACEFLEWEQVYEGKYYGTLRKEIDRLWQAGNIPILDIDVKGALNILENFKGDVLSVFVQAPSIEVLRERLIKRGTESEASLNERVGKAAYELTFADKFHHRVVNDNLDRATKELLDITAAFLNSNA